MRAARWVRATRNALISRLGWGGIAASARNGVHLHHPPAGAGGYGPGPDALGPLPSRPAGGGYGTTPHGGGGGYRSRQQLGTGWVQLGTARKATSEASKPNNLNFEVAVSEIGASGLRPCGRAQAQAPNPSGSSQRWNVVGCRFTNSPDGGSTMPLVIESGTNRSRASSISSQRGYRPGLG